MKKPERRDIRFYIPGIKRYETSELAGNGGAQFPAVSITGANCALMCEHCAAKILRRMPAALTPEDLHAFAVRLKARDGQGLLITGGSDATGRVPLGCFLSTIRRIKDELELLISVHTGLVDRELAEGLAAANVDRAMLDVIGHGETIRKVYHLKASPEDFYRSVELLVDTGLRVVPHVVIGLHYGTVLGEEECLKRLSGYDLHALVLVILSFTEGTPMEDILPPPVAAVARLFRTAKGLFPRIPVILGCARPAGDYKAEIDREAVLAGLDGIAYPAEGVVAYSISQGRTPVVSHCCCSL